MQPIISVSNVTKTYASGLEALKGVSLDIYRGEIFALLGPNGAGKTTLIGIICGIVNASGGTVTVDGYDNRAGLPRGTREDRARAAGTDDGHVRIGLGHRVLQPRLVREAAEPRLH